MLALKPHRGDRLRVLIIRLSSMGDVINTMPTACAIKRARPDYWLGWLVDEPLACLVRRASCVDEVIPQLVPNGRTLKPGDLTSGRLWRTLATTIRRLRSRFDVALDFHGLLRSAAWGWVAGAPVRVGFADEMRECNYLFTTHRIRPGGIHAADRFLGMAQWLTGIQGDIEHPPLYDETDQRRADELLLHHGIAADEPMFALQPGCSRRVNLWPAYRFSAAGDLLAERGYGRPVITGSAAERGLARLVAARMRTPAAILAGETSLNVLAAVLARSGLVVTGDTGPMHMAGAVGAPVVAVMGPADPRTTGPRGNNSIVVREPFPCQPCRKRPTCQFIDCMHAVTPETVVAAAERLAPPDEGGGAP